MSDTQVTDGALMPDQPIPKHYVVAELARILSLREETIRVKLRAGHIKGENVDGIWRVPKAEVMRYLSEGNAKPEENRDNGPQ